MAFDSMNLSNRKMREYLLGQLPEDAAAALEERFFQDQELSLAMQMEQDCLLEEFVEGRLSREDETVFRAQCMRSPLLQEEARALRALFAAGGRRRESSRIWKLRGRAVLLPASAALAATLAMAAFLIHRSHENGGLDARLDRMPATASIPPSERGSTAVVFLSAIVPRGAADLPVIAIPKGASRVELEIDLRGSRSEADDWHAELRSGTGAVWEAAHLPRSRAGQESFLTLAVDGRLLTGGAWSVRFYPSADPGAGDTRYFRVTRSP